MSFFSACLAAVTSVKNVPTDGRYLVSGKVLVNGSPVSPQHWQLYRRQIGAVMQDDRLLSGAIPDNIAFFQADLSMDLVIEAAMAAGVHDDMNRMPVQYRSLIGDMGSSLSGGQRQRVCWRGLCTAATASSVGRRCGKSG